MTTLTFAGLRSPVTNPIGKPGPRRSGLLTRITSAYGVWRAERALASLGDDALHDIGLDRASIAHAVRTGARS